MQDDLVNERNVLIKVEAFNDVYFDCYRSALLTILNNMSGSVVPFVINDMFLYEYRDEAGMPLIEIKANSIFSPENLLNGIGMSVSFISKSEDVIKDLIKSLDAGHAVIVFIDIFYESLRPDYFNQVHNGHYLAIYGYNRQKEYFNIIEHEYIESMIYKPKQISFSDVKNCYYGALDNLEDTKFPKYQEFSKTGSRIFDDEYYIHEYLKTIYKQKQKVVESVNAVDKFKECLIEFLSKNLNELNDLNIMTESINNIIIVKKIEKYRFAKIFGNAQEAVSKTEVIISNWNAIRCIFEKYKITKTMSPKVMKAIIEMLDEIKQIELESYSILCKIYEEGR